MQVLQGLRTVLFPVADLAAARDWYSAVLGHGPYFDEPFYVGFDAGGYELGLQPLEGRPPSNAGSVAYWAVEDVDAALARLLAAGASLLAAAEDVGGGIRVASVTDPFGNALGLIHNPHFRPKGDAVRGPVTVVEEGARLGAEPGDLSARAIVHQRWLPRPPAEVWPRWASAEGLTSWLVDRARVELRIGGAYEPLFLLDAPEGAQGAEGCRVLCWLPERMIAFTWNAPPHLERTRRAHTWVVVELEARDGGTALRLTHCGWPERAWGEPGSQWPETFAYFEAAWGRVLDRLLAAVGA